LLAPSSVTFYQTAQCKNLEKSHLRNHCRENLKSHLFNGNMILNAKDLSDLPMLVTELKINFFVYDMKLSCQLNTFELHKNFVNILIGMDDLKLKKNYLHSDTKQAPGYRRTR
jgi:hypothetical protein